MLNRGAMQGSATDSAAILRGRGRSIAAAPGPGARLSGGGLFALVSASRPVFRAGWGTGAGIGVVLDGAQ